VQNELLKSLGLRDVGVREAHFAVLRTANMPSTLAEIAFISNNREESLLRTDNFKNKAAEAIARGIGLYFAGSRMAGFLALPPIIQDRDRAGHSSRERGPAPGHFFPGGFFPQVRALTERPRCGKVINDR